MPPAEQQTQPAQISPRAAFVVLCGAASAMAALAAVPVILLAHLPLMLVPATFAAAGFAATLLWNTGLGLCFAAFSIAPLGAIEYEVAGITINLPEALIVVLFAKEAVRFVADRERPSPFLPRRSLLAFLLASVIALMTGLARGNGIVPALQDMRQFTEFVALYLLVVHRVPALVTPERILASFLFGCVLVAGHGILQSLTGRGIPGTQLLSDQIFIGAIRGGSFYGATPLGGMMVMAAGAAISLILGGRTTPARVMALGALALCVAAAVCTYTRASWIALFLSLLFIFSSIKKTPAVISLATAGAMVFAVIFGPRVVERLESLAISKSERSLYVRVQYYTAAWHIFRQYPLLGLGWGCEYDVHSILVNGRCVRTRDFSERFGSEKSTVHSAYLQILAKTGSVGLVTFAAFLAAWLRMVWQERLKRPRDDLLHGLFIGVTGGLVGYLAHSAGENFFQWAVMSQSFYLLLGCSTVLAARILQQAGTAPENQPLCPEV